MLQIASLTYQDLFCLICQQCKTKTRNEYLGAHQFRVTCPHCRETMVLTFDHLCWSGLSPNQASSETESRLANVPRMAP